MRAFPWTLFLVAAVASGANLLSNPGLEEWMNDSTPAHWEVENRGRTAVYKETDTVRTGEAAARLVRRNLPPGNNYGLMQRVGIRPNTSYRYSVWCRDDASQIALGVGITWRRVDTSYISGSGIVYSGDSSSWQPLVDSICSPAEAGIADFRIRTYARSGTTGENRVLVDDTYLGPVEFEPDTVRIWFARDSLGQRLVDFFGQAQASIDYCCYNSSRSDVVQALVDAGNRGVQIRIVTDNNRLENPWVGQLRNAGIPVWSDSIGPNSANYMHNKFAVRDLADADSTNDRVWVASYNPNQGELRADCALEIPSPGLARAFRTEFKQMWGCSGPAPLPESARFHNAKRDMLSTHRFEVNNNPAYVYFGPQDRPVDTITVLAAAAENHLLFGVLAYTYDDLGDAMIQLWKDSIWVGGVIDKSGALGQGSEFDRLVQTGLPVYIDSVPFGQGVLHEKVMVIDSTITIAGSANWSNNGNRNNDENIIVLHDPGIAARFLEELHERFWEASNPGIGEQPGAVVRPGTRVVSPVRDLAVLPEDAELYDASGRKVESMSRLSPGVYFLKVGDRGATSVVIVR